MRVFSDENGKLNLSIKDVGGEILFVSNFTVYADTSKGRRPSFDAAAKSDVSRPLYGRAVGILEELGLKVKTGVFGADMLVDIKNDGPITVIVEKSNERSLD